MIEETRTYQQQLDTLKSDIRDLRSDLKGLISVLRHDSKTRLQVARQRIREAAHDRMEQLRELASRGADEARHAYEHARDYGHKAVTTAQSRVSERPLTSLLAAFGVGWLIGRIMRHRRR